MSAFGAMFPGHGLGKEAKDEDSTGEGEPRLPEGPLDLESGVVRLQPPPDPSPDSDSD